MNKIKYLYDLETFYDFFCAVFKPPKGDKKSYLIFEISNFQDDSKALYEFLLTNPKLIAYNSLGFDSQVLEEFMNCEGNMTGNELYEFAQRVITSERPPYSAWKLEHTTNLDLMKMWGYGRGPKATSVKWLEFTLRMKSLKDLPVDFRKPVKSRSTGDAIVKYCKHDVDALEEFYMVSEGLIKRRAAIGKVNGEEFYNTADQNIGEDLMLKAMAKRLGEKPWDLRKKRSTQSHIYMKDVILPYVKFKTPEFNKVLDFYTNLRLKSESDGTFVLKNVISTHTNFGGIDIHYGAGGIHASRVGVFRETDTMSIIDEDVASYYPNLAIANEFYPAHLGVKFCKEYQDKYIERKSYPKSNPMNAAIKLMLNSAFGKSKSIHSFLYDVKGMFLPITINGQLLLSMLAEKLVLNGAKLIQINTDGLSYSCTKGTEEKYNKICRQWEKLTKLELEQAKYSLMAIENVNNYLAIYKDGKVKRKGRFEIYQDIIGSECYYKNTSAGVVAKAVNEYFVNQTPIEDTIENETDIYEFLYGKKKTSAFIHEVAKADDQGRVSGKLYSDRVLRFYMSTDGGSLRKLWKDFRITSINKEGLITPLQYVRSPLAARYLNLNRSWYVSEAYKIIDSIEGSEFI